MSFDEQRYLQTTIESVFQFPEGLFELKLAHSADFEAGQFVKLGLIVGGAPVSRAYSIASPPGEPLRFLIQSVNGGALTPHLAKLKAGDSIYVYRKIVGHFTLDNVPAARSLWLFSTSTGIAPFLSMLSDSRIKRYDNVIMVHNLRLDQHVLPAMMLPEGIDYVPVVSRSPDTTHLAGRFITHLTNGHIESKYGSISPESSQVMLCGNPGMIQEMTNTLIDRGLTLHTPKRPGQIHVERFW